MQMFTTLVKFGFRYVYEREFRHGNDRYYPSQAECAKRSKENAFESVIYAKLRENPSES